MTDKQRPLVTFALLAYNQEAYIREAVEGALAQDYQPLEIILSDDHSTDSTFEIIKGMAEAYIGPHRLILNRNVRNLGIASHFNHVIRIASGRIVVLAAGDDISLETRTSDTVRAMNMWPEATFVEVGESQFTNSSCVPRVPDYQSGADTPAHFVFLHDYVHGKAVQLVGALRAINRKKLLTYDPLGEDCPTEDTPSLLRLLMIGRGLKLEKIGVFRRIHDQNLSSLNSLKRMNLSTIYSQYSRDIQTAKNLGYISSDVAKQLMNWANVSVERRLLTTAASESLSHFLRVLWGSRLSPGKKAIELVRYIKRKAVQGIRFQ